MKIKQKIPLEQVVLHPDIMLLEVQKASEKFDVVQFSLDYDKPFNVILTGNKVTEFMPILPGDQVFLENQGAQPYIEITFEDSDKVMKCILMYASTVKLLLKPKKVDVNTFDGMVISGMQSPDTYQGDSNVVSPALEQQRDAIPET